MLLKHQIDPILHLVARCKQQHGILLYHGMGTGKTLIALYMLMNYLKYNIVIILPAGIIPVWEHEAKVLSIGFILKKIKFVEYNKATNFLDSLNNPSDTVIVFDEIHKLVPLLTENDGRKIIRKLNECKKIIGLSGTPLYSKESDLRIIINIVAGKQVFPYNELAYISEYYKINKVNAAVYGWIVPLIAHGALTYLDLMGMAGPNGPKHIFSFGKALSKYITGDSPSANQAVLAASAAFELDTNTRLAETSYVSLKRDGIQNIADFVAQVFRIKDPTANVLIGSFLPSLVGPTLMLATTLTKYYSTLSKHPLKSPNIKKICKVLGPYVDYYMHPRGDPNYATVTQYNKIVSYSIPQVTFWLKMTQNKLTNEEFKMLDYPYDIDSEFDLFATIRGIDEFKNKGRVIGNLCLKDVPSPKFEAVIKKIQNKQAVVYSNFYNHGVKLFAQMLKQNRIKYEVVTPTQSSVERSTILAKFKYRKIQVLLLHPSITEGVSIAGAEQLHILEPMDNLAVKSQLIARTVRYKSHEHVPVKDRNVHVYQWECDNSKFVDKLKKLVVRFNDWRKHDLHMFFTEVPVAFADNLTPDMMYSRDIDDTKDFLDGLDKVLKSKEGFKGVYNCSPWGITVEGAEKKSC